MTRLPQNSINTSDFFFINKKTIHTAKKITVKKLTTIIINNDISFFIAKKILNHTNLIA